MFGTLAHDGSAWHGQVVFGTPARDVAVFVVTGGAEPGSRERELFTGLVARYASMAPDIAGALFELYAPWQEAALEGLPPSPSPESLLTLTALNWMEIHADGRIHLGYGFVDGAGWDDATFTLAIVDGAVVAESLDD